MASTSAETTEPQRVAFRPGKKRKIYRHRDADDSSPLPSTPEQANLTPSASDVPTEPPAEAEGLSVTEALRLRHARKGRLGGVAFRAGSTPRADESDNAEQSLVPHEGTMAENQVVGGITKRFARQTGLAVDSVNKHMEEYVESELARRHAAEALAAAAAAAADGNMDNLQQQIQHSGSGTFPAPGDMATATATATGKPVVAQPAMHGKLLEIDLGDEVRARNIAMTERARRKALGENVDEEEEEGGENSSRPRKVRLGRDGKPWRGRKRRGSEDVKRDQLVEEFLRENRLDVYDIPANQETAAGPGTADGDATADDRIAEEFRRDFMDAMMQRQQRRRPASNAKPVGKGAKTTEEVLKGPKLGGSRNSRAAMRDLLLKEQERKR